jgi:hypothetical protein
MTTTEAKWAERVQQWKASGRRPEEFAEGQPYKASTLRWWATELRRRSAGDAERAKRSGASGAIRMARVVRRVPPDKDGAGLIVGNGRARIRLERGFDGELLAEVVRAIGGGQ